MGKPVVQYVGRHYYMVPVARKVIHFGKESKRMNNVKLFTGQNYEFQEGDLIDDKMRAIYKSLQSVGVYYHPKGLPILEKKEDNTFIVTCGNCNYIYKAKKDEAICPTCGYTEGTPFCQLCGSIIEQVTEDGDYQCTNAKCANNISSDDREEKCLQCVDGKIIGDKCDNPDCESNSAPDIFKCVNCDFGVIVGNNCNNPKCVTNKFPEQLKCTICQTNMIEDTECEVDNQGNRPMKCANPECQSNIPLFSNDKVDPDIGNEDSEEETPIEIPGKKSINADIAEFNAFLDSYTDDELKELAGTNSVKLTKKDSRSKIIEKLINTIPQVIIGLMTEIQ